MNVHAVRGAGAAHTFTQHSHNTFKSDMARLVRGKIFQNRTAWNAVAARLTSLMWTLRKAKCNLHLLSNLFAKSCAACIERATLFLWNGVVCCQRFCHNDSGLVLLQCLLVLPLLFFFARSGVFLFYLGFLWKMCFFLLWLNFRNICCITVFSIQEYNSLTGINVQSQYSSQYRWVGLGDLVA